MTHLPSILSLPRSVALACALAALPATWDYVKFMNREGTPVLGLPFSWVFFPFVILMLALVVRCAIGIWQAVRGVGLDAELNLT